MNQFFIDSSAMAGDKIVITGSDVNHIGNVLKLRVGEEVSLVNTSDGLTYYCILETVAKDAVTCTIQDVQSESTELPVRITLFQGLPKGDKLEFVIQKSVEMGAVKIVPVSMKRSVMKIDPKKMDAKVKRFNAIAASAASQSKRGIIPEVSAVVTLKQAIEEVKDYDEILLPYELAKGMDETREILETIKTRLSSKIEGGETPRIAIFIGPEGGFDPTEVELLQQSGAHIITLGKRILRTETAPLSILAWLTYLFD